MSEPRWVTWSRRLQAIAQTGRHYTEGHYDRERYEQIAQVAAEILAEHTSAGEREAIERLWSSDDGYATPKTDIRGAVFNGRGELLMVRETSDEGRWTLPGGWADVNTLPSQNVEREVLEEAGYRVRAVKLLACYDHRLHGHPPYMFHLYKLFFRCELLDETPVPSPQGGIECSEASWFDEAALPADHELSTGRVTGSQLRRIFEHLRNPGWPADFD